MKNSLFWSNQQHNTILSAIKLTCVNINISITKNDLWVEKQRENGNWLIWFMKKYEQHKYEISIGKIGSSYIYTYTYI